MRAAVCLQEYMWNFSLSAKLLPWKPQCAAVFVGRAGPYDSHKGRVSINSNLMCGQQSASNVHVCLPDLICTQGPGLQSVT